ncbi:MAG TPA: DNA polymerase III subunit gamma/tau [Nitrospiraceae bacterium]|nr:DNA polymerase III subunit gamma/tau [Nitrospiraceae bacterium]
MSYLVLARKWRPQSFDDLTGQEAVSRTLKNALSHGKVAHAYLFSGPRGVGKTSTARILAKALNCFEGPTANPCGQCQNCKAVSDGYSVDVFEIDGASNNSVDDIRELREAVKYAPSSGRYRVYIIDEVHMLSESAFNALLKTLEEPPGHVVFIFATTAPKKIPATILSRCQHLTFHRIPKGIIKDRLSKIAEAEGIKIKQEAIELIARASDGSMRDALTILDQAVSFSNDIGEKELQSLLGLPEVEIISKLTEGLLDGNVVNGLSLINDLTERGYDLRPIARELIEYMRNIAIVKIMDNPEHLLDFTEDEIEGYKNLASKANMEELTLLLSELLKLESDIRTTTNPRYLLELGIIRASFIKGMTSIGDVLSRLNALSNEQKSACPAPASSYEVGAGEPEELLQNVIKKIEGENHLLSCKLMEAEVVGLTEKEFTIGFNGGLAVLADAVKKDINIVESVIKELTGNKLKVKVISLKDKKRKNDIGKTKENIFSDPIVKKTLELFNGKLLEIKSLEGSSEKNGG